MKRRSAIWCCTWIHLVSRRWISSSSTWSGSRSWRSRCSARTVEALATSRDDRQRAAAVTADADETSPGLQELLVELVAERGRPRRPDRQAASGEATWSSPRSSAAPAKAGHGSDQRGQNRRSCRQGGPRYGGELHDPGSAQRPARFFCQSTASIMPFFNALAGGGRSPMSQELS